MKIIYLRVSDLNIIGTANIVKLCKKCKIKLSYFTANYHYPGIEGKLQDPDALNPINNYAWSKLRGESAPVHLYKKFTYFKTVYNRSPPFIHKSN